jgi:hypothetical protein
MKTSHTLTAERFLICLSKSSFSIPHLVEKPSSLSQLPYSLNDIVSIVTRHLKLWILRRQPWNEDLMRSFAFSLHYFTSPHFQQRRRGVGFPSCHAWCLEKSYFKFIPLLLKKWSGGVKCSWPCTKLCNPMKCGSNLSATRLHCCYNKRQTPLAGKARSEEIGQIIMIIIINTAQFIIFCLPTFYLKTQSSELKNIILYTKCRGWVVNTPAS